TVLCVTHTREMVDKMRRRVLALDEGRLVRDQATATYHEESTSEFGVRVRAEMGVREGHTNGEPAASPPEFTRAGACSSSPRRSARCGPAPHPAAPRSSPA